MRLTPERIESLTTKLVEALRHIPEIHLTDEKLAAAAIKHAIVADLEREDRLEDDTRALLRKHANQIHGDNLDYDALFQRAKRQLARERKIVL